MNNKYKKVFNSLLIVLIVLYVFSTGNKLQSGYRIYKYGIPILIIIYFGMTKKIVINSSSNIRWGLILLYWMMGLIYSINRVDTFNYVKSMIAMYPILFYEFDDEFIEKLFEYFKIIILIGAISCFLSAFNFERMSSFYQLFLAKESSYTEFEINGNSFSGLFGEKSHAAFCLDVGIGIIVSEIFSKKKYEKKDLIFLIIYILALILANKRMLLVIPIVSVSVLFALSDQENKLLKGTIIGLGGVIVLIVIINTIPQFASVFERFQMEGNNRKN